MSFARSIFLLPIAALLAVPASAQPEEERREPAPAVNPNGTTPSVSFDGKDYAVRSDGTFCTGTMCQKAEVQPDGSYKPSGESMPEVYREMNAKTGSEALGNAANAATSKFALSLPGMMDAAVEGYKAYRTTLDENEKTIYGETKNPDGTENPDAGKIAGTSYQSRTKDAIMADVMGTKAGKEFVDKNPEVAKILEKLKGLAVNYETFEVAGGLVDGGMGQMLTKAEQDLLSAMYKAAKEEQKAKAEKENKAPTDTPATTAADTADQIAGATDPEQQAKDIQKGLESGDKAAQEQMLAKLYGGGDKGAGANAYGFGGGDTQGDTGSKGRGGQSGDLGESGEGGGQNDGTRSGALSWDNMTDAQKDAAKKHSKDRAEQLAKGGPAPGIFSSALNYGKSVYESVQDIFNQPAMAALTNMNAQGSQIAAAAGECQDGNSSCDRAKHSGYMAWGPVKDQKVAHLEEVGAGTFGRSYKRLACSPGQPC